MKANASSDDQKLQYDVDGFAQFLANRKSIATLLLWKDVEDYATLFGVQERAAAAEKIFTRYIRPGAEYELTALSEQVVKDIKEQLDNPPDDLFTELQAVAYNMMLFELFPAFWNEIKQQV